MAVVFLAHPQMLRRSASGLAPFSSISRTTTSNRAAEVNCTFGSTQTACSNSSLFEECSAVQRCGTKRKDEVFPAILERGWVGDSKCNSRFAEPIAWRVAREASDLREQQMLGPFLKNRKDGWLLSRGVHIDRNSEPNPRYRGSSPKAGSRLYIDTVSNKSIGRPCRRRAFANHPRQRRCLLYRGKRY